MLKPKRSKGTIRVMKVAKAFIISMSVFSILALSACVNPDKEGGHVINMAILADEAWLNEDGEFINGVRLAEEDLNAEYSGKGYKIGINVIDDKAVYETGVEMATIVAEDPGVTAVFNLQNFDVSKTTSDILTASGKIVFFPYGAYDSLFKGDDPNVFCGVPSFADLGGAMAQYAVEKGFKRVAVYHNGKQSQEELVTAFELALINTGVKIIDYVPSIASSSEFNSIYMRWQALGADCVVISQYGLERAFEVLKLLRVKDATIPVIGEPIFNRANALAVHRDIAEGMAAPSTLMIESSSRLDGFNAKYRAKYGKEADIWAVQGYDMARLVVDTAIKHDTADPAVIAAALHEMESYQGVGRQISFNAGGSMVTDINMLPMLICRDGIFKTE